MKKTVSVLLCILLFCVGVFPAPLVYAARGTTYYIDSIDGSDETCDGLSPGTAWKTVPVTECTLTAGDAVLFRRGGVYTCTLTIRDSRGAAEAPILVSAYGEGEQPHLTTDESTEVLRLFDCSYVTVSDLEITAHNGGGIWINAYKGESSGITLERLKIHDIQNYTVTSRDNLMKGAAAARACVMVKGLPTLSLHPVHDFTVRNCEMYDCGNGISLWGAFDFSKGNPFEGDEFSECGPVYNKNALIRDSYFHDMDAEAVVIGICDGALMTHCRVIDCCQGEGVDETGKVLYFTAAAWFWGSENSTIEYCEIAGQKNVGDGMTVDFDSQSNHCTYQYIYSHDNVRFVVNNAKTSAQVGNVVRYCLSVNDDKGRNRLTGGPGERGLQFYNNTIIGSQRFDLDGIYDSYFVNNIIVFQEGYRFYPTLFLFERRGSVLAGNCCYNCISGRLTGAQFNTIPGFSGTDETSLASFMLSKDSPLIGAGVPLPFDDCTTDFFGNPIVSRNIGCYAGKGTDAPYKAERFLTKLARFFRTIFQVAYKLLTEGI